MTSGEGNTEGSWIPSLSVCILVLLWWISRSQSPRAVRIRRWYSTKVRRRSTVLCRTIGCVLFASYCTALIRKINELASLCFHLNTNCLAFFRCITSRYYCYYNILVSYFATTVWTCFENGSLLFFHRTLTMRCI